MTTTYRASSGFHLSHKDAEIIGAAFTKLERKLKRAVHAEDLVGIARPDTSPLHRYFEWDDTIAAQKYRVSQARYIITAIDVLLPDRSEAPVRAFIPVDYGQRSTGFISTATASPEIIARQVERAREDARSVVERYQQWIAFSEFAPAADFVVAARRLATT